MEASMLLDELTREDPQFANQSFGFEDAFRKTKRLRQEQIVQNNTFRQKQLAEEEKKQNKNAPSNAQGFNTASKAKVKVSSLALMQRSRYKPGVDTSKFVSQAHIDKIA